MAGSMPNHRNVQRLKRLKAAASKNTGIVDDKRALFNNSDIGLFSKRSSDDDLLPFQQVEWNRMAPKLDKPKDDLKVNGT